MKDSKRERVMGDIAMDKDRLLAGGIDYDAAVERFAGQASIYERYLMKFLEDSHISDAKEALLREDYEAVLEQAHALKGLAGTLGMTELHRASGALVNDLRADVREGTAEKLEKLDGEQERMRDVIRDAGI